MDAELDLTDIQHAKVEDLIRESQKRTRELWDRMRPQVHAEVSSLRKQIRSELTAVQQQKFDELNRFPVEPAKGKQLMERRNAPIIFTNSN